MTVADVFRKRHSGILVRYGFPIANGKLYGIGVTGDVRTTRGEDIRVLQLTFRPVADSGLGTLRGA